MRREYLATPGSITAGNVFYRQVADTMGNPNGVFVVWAHGGVAVRTGDRITLSPGLPC